MVLSELLLKIPYGFAWRLANASNNAFPVVFYCTDYLDYQIFEPIRKHLPELTIVAKNREVQEVLANKDIQSILYPVYPKAVIMARHAFHLFPSSKILKIGMRHGAYHFKNFIKAEKYNKFDLFLFTSEDELKIAKDLGIENGAAAGYPKIEALHNGSISEAELENLRTEIDLDKNKKTILFSATWNNSEISSIEKWYDKLDLLSDDYNILVTVHPFTDDKFKEKIKTSQNVYLIENEDLNPYLFLADLLIADTSSIIADFNSLLKPIVTFRVEQQGRLNPFIIKMLDEISIRVDEFDQLKNAISEAFDNNESLVNTKTKYNEIMFSNISDSSKVAAELIEAKINSRGISFD